MFQHPDPPDCVCGHAWEDHHHGCIMNPEWPVEHHATGICGGVAAQECEHDQVNGEYSVPREQACKCSNYNNHRTLKCAYDARFKKADNE